MKWYLDVYAYDACLGTEFPVNSYFSDDLTKLTSAAARLLQKTLLSGVDEIRICRTSEGQSPVSIDEVVEPNETTIRHHDEEFVEGLI